jgi:hypothetical protein
LCCGGRSSATSGELFFQITQAGFQVSQLGIGGWLTIGPTPHPVLGLLNVTL